MAEMNQVNANPIDFYQNDQNENGSGTKNNNCFRIPLLLEKIENLENEVANTNSLLREVLTSIMRNESRMNAQTSFNTGNGFGNGGQFDQQSMFRNQMPPQNPIKPYYKIHLIRDAYDQSSLIGFEVGGRTYEIRSNLRDMGAKEFDKEKKVWVFDYSDDVYNRVLEYLKTQTDDIKVLE